MEQSAVTVGKIVLSKTEKQLQAQFRYSEQSETLGNWLLLFQTIITYRFHCIDKGKYP